MAQELSADKAHLTRKEKGNALPNVNSSVLNSMHYNNKMSIPYKIIFESLSSANPHANMVHTCFLKCFVLIDTNNKSCRYWSRLDCRCYVFLWRTGFSKITVGKVWTVFISFRNSESWFTSGACWCIVCA